MKVTDQLVGRVELVSDAAVCDVAVPVVVGILLAHMQKT